MSAMLRDILDSHIGLGGKQPRICSYHKLRHRHSGRYHWVDFHVVVPANWNIAHGHEVASAIEYEIEQALGEGNATAHVEPCIDPSCAAAPERRNRRERNRCGDYRRRAIALANHLPGLALASQARLVALCDTDRATLDRAAMETGVKALFTDYHDAIAHDSVDAVIVATPNFTHAPIVLAAVASKKHVLCEKPIALDFASAHAMYQAAEAAHVRHMTAFTYRFVPAMRYMKHLVDSGSIGTPIHFRAQRFQDWGERPLGWRQVKMLAGTGELGDMLSHRIDYAHHLVGPIRRLVASVRTFVPVRGGQPSDVDDWVAMLCEFEDSPATGVLESTKLATGRGEGHRGQDVVEINGTDGTIVYSTQTPLTLRVGKSRRCGFARRCSVPTDFYVWPGSPRDPSQGDPLATFRYDQDFEFFDAIQSNRPCRPTLYDGMRAQAVMDGVIESDRRQAWIDIIG